MTILEFIVGKKISIMTDAKVEVELTIESIKPFIEETIIKKGNKENDFVDEYYDTKKYQITFTNGYIKIYEHIDYINFKD